MSIMGVATDFPNNSTNFVRVYLVCNKNREKAKDLT